MKCTAFILPILLLINEVTSIRIRLITSGTIPTLSKNDTDRYGRDNRKYFSNTNKNRFRDDFDDFRSRRQRQKPKTTTPPYDYDEFEDSKYNSYLPKPIYDKYKFNQKDINDVYIKGNNDYMKLVKNFIHQSNFGEDDGYKTIVSYEKKRPVITSQSYGNTHNFGDYKENFDEYVNSWKPSSPPATSSFSFSSPTKNFDDFPLKTYASGYNFDTKPHSDIETNKFNIPYGQVTVKNLDFVSEFDSKGNPLPSSSSVYDSGKNVYDYQKASSNTNYYGNYYGSKKPDVSSYAADFHYYGRGTDYGFGKYDPQSHISSYKPVGVSQPIIVPVPQPYPVKVPIAKPVAVPILKEIKVPIEKVVPYPVVKNVPYPVEKRIPVPVEKQVAVPVPKPYPVKVPVIKNVYHHAEDEEEPIFNDVLNKYRNRGNSRDRYRDKFNEYRDDYQDFYHDDYEDSEHFDHYFTDHHHHQQQHHNRQQQPQHNQHYHHHHRQPYRPGRHRFRDRRQQN